MSASYDILKDKKGKVIEILKFNVNHLIQGPFRRLKFRQKYRKPWCIEVTERLHYKIFFEQFEAIEDHCVSFGRTTEIHRDKTKLRKVKGYTITFHHLGALKFHIRQTVSKKKLVLEKKNKTAGAKAIVAVSAKKPAVLHFDIKKEHLILCLRYELLNRYSVLCSF